ncbi:sodium:solute symporter family transporter [Marinifilum sp.]|uniref:sodium:solute symporter family transporter n=1 Tax=Marinifilum sp. TaxID=2033137 RepID=UPI003BAA87A7
MNISTIDLIIIIAFLVGITLIGIFQMRNKRETSDSFFLAGRDLKWPLIGLSLFAANISTIHLVGLAASGFNEGLVWGSFEWLAGISLILLAVIFAPFYFKSRVQTLPEFLERRYDSRSRTVFAFIAILGALFVHIGLSLYTGAIIFQRFFGISAWTSIFTLSALTLVYYLAGGLKAVVYTQAVQTGVLIFGSVALTIAGLMKLGVFMEESTLMANAAIDGSVQQLGFIDKFMMLIREGQLDVLHTNESITALTGSINEDFSANGFDTLSGSGLTWYAAFLGYPILGLWYWCSDQTIVQQVLAAKTKSDAQRGPIFAGFLKLLTPFIMIVPGIIGYILFKQDIYDAAHSAIPAVSRPGDVALSVLIDKLLPVGLSGLFAAALMAALMSTIAAALNSISTLVSVDIYKRVKPETNDKSLIKIGRVAAICIMALAAMWSTQGDKFSSVFEAINKVAAALSPPVATVLLLGVLYKRGTKEASLITLISGLVLGMTLFVLDFKFTPTGTSIVTEVWGIPFMMQAWWSFCICVVIYLIVSKLTPKSDAKVIKEYTWENPLAIVKGKIEKLNDIRVLVMLLLITIAALYAIFS